MIECLIGASNLERPALECRSRTESTLNDVQVEELAVILENQLFQCLRCFLHLQQSTKGGQSGERESARDTDLDSLAHRLVHGKIQKLLLGDLGNHGPEIVAKIQCVEEVFKPFSP